MSKIILEEEKSIDKSIIEDSIECFKEEYKLDEAAVEKVFKDIDNNSEENIFIKTVVLNDRYSAGLNRFKSTKAHIAVDVESMSKILFEYAKEGQFDKYDGIENICKLINEISNIEDKNKPVSFLSKFLHWNFYVKDNNVRIPIYDRYTRGMIFKLCEKLLGKSINKKDLRDYGKFCDIYFEVMNNLIKKYELVDFSVKKFDMFLWYYGKKKGIYLD